MKRVWRFLALLSVTPIMTVVCVVTLGWMTWRVMDQAQEGIAADLKQKFRIVTPTDVWLSVARSQASRAEHLLIVEEAGRARLEDAENALHHPRILASLFITKGVQKRGVFAPTEVADSVTAMVAPFDASMSIEQARDYVLQKCRSTTGLQVYQSALASGIAQTAITGANIAGYVTNAAAISLIAMGLWSLRWLWRGAKMPWGVNAAWKQAANGKSKAWWTSRVLVISPLMTGVCAVCAWLMVMVNRAPFTDQMAQWQAEMLVWKYPTYTPAPTLSLWHLIRVREPAKATVITKRVRCGIIPSTNPDWFAPMWTASEPCLQFIVDDADNKARRRYVVRELFGYLPSMPDDLDELWIAPQTRHVVWKGVAYNAVLAGFALLMIISCRWLIDGVVWPWQARRLRQGVCIKCGYSLVGLNAEKCPECGTVIELKMAS